jgi:hypothetical protein
VQRPQSVLQARELGLEPPERLAGLAQVPAAACRLEGAGGVRGGGRREVAQRTVERMRRAGQKRFTPAPARYSW